MIYRWWISMDFFHLQVTNLMYWHVLAGFIGFRMGFEVWVRKKYTSAPKHWDGLLLNRSHYFVFHRFSMFSHGWPIPNGPIGAQCFCQVLDKPQSSPSSKCWQPPLSRPPCQWVLAETWRMVAPSPHPHPWKHVGSPKVLKWSGEKEDMWTRNKTNKFPFAVSFGTTLIWKKT